MRCTHHILVHNSFRFVSIAVGCIQQENMVMSETHSENERENNSTRPLNSKIKANAGEKQLNSSVGTKQLNSTGENNSTRQHERNNSTQQQERTTQLNRRKQLNSTVGTKQLNSALPSTAYNRLHRFYSRIGFFYLLTCTGNSGWNSAFLVCCSTDDDYDASDFDLMEVQWSQKLLDDLLLDPDFLQIIVFFFRGVILHDICISFEVRAKMLHMDNFDKLVLECSRFDLVAHGPDWTNNHKWSFEDRREFVISLFRPVL
ncbi:hypothetical protein TNCV_66871 [Trichonephila clavipes]|nr:hypothetical protein TNCV_66871 [Trichonephila clavipes]